MGEVVEARTSSRGVCRSEGECVPSSIESVSTVRAPLPPSAPGSFPHLRNARPGFLHRLFEVSACRTTDDSWHDKAATGPPESGDGHRKHLPLPMDTGGTEPSDRRADRLPAITSGNPQTIRHVYGLFLYYRDDRSTGLGGMQQVASSVFDCSSVATVHQKTDGTLLLFLKQSYQCKIISISVNFTDCSRDAGRKSSRR